MRMCKCRLNSKPPHPCHSTAWLSWEHYRVRTWKPSRPLTVYILPYSCADKAGFRLVQCFSCKGWCAETEVWITCPGLWFEHLLSRVSMSHFRSKQHSLPVEKSSGEPPASARFSRATLPLKCDVHWLAASPSPPSPPVLSPKRTCQGLLSPPCKDSTKHAVKISGPLYFLWLPYLKTQNIKIVILIILEWP